MPGTLSKFNISVALRVRPMNAAEKAAKSQDIIQFLDKNGAVYLRTKDGGKEYTFDNVFGPEATQEEVYERLAKRYIQDLIEGRNGTLLAYGPTGTGKTFTFEGTEMDQGILFRTVNDLFKKIAQMKEENGKDTINVTISYFEVYLDRINDFLGDKKENLQVQEQDPRVIGLTRKDVERVEDVIRAFNEGKQHRKIGKTERNRRSSRSHSVFIIYMDQKIFEEKNLESKLILVDLAGSENAAKASAVGVRLKQTCDINLGLHYFVRVIEALALESEKKLKGKIGNHIGYRNCKLTMILKDSLGGNSRTTMILNCSPASCKEDETNSTLQFATKVKTITNTVVVNEVITPQQRYKRLQKELQEALAALANCTCRNAPGEPLDIAEPNRFERERDKLCTELSQKTDSIQKLSRYIENLNKQMENQEERISAARLENHSLLQIINDFLLQAEAGAEEGKETHENRESREALNEELSHKRELQQQMENQGKRFAEMLRTLRKGLADASNALGIDSGDKEFTPAENGNIEEEYTVANLLISRINTETRCLSERCHKLESEHAGCNKKIRTNTRELDECRQLISQHEDNMRFLQKSMELIGEEKKNLEKTVAALKKECVELKKEEKRLVETCNDLKEREKFVNKQIKTMQERMVSTAKQQIKELEDHHQKQINDLQNELAEAHQKHQKQLITLQNELAEAYQKQLKALQNELALLTTCPPQAHENRHGHFFNVLTQIFESE